MGPVDQVQVNVVESESLERVSDGFINFVEAGEPELGGDEELLTLDNSLGDAVLDGLSDEGLVLVEPGGVDVSVAEGDGSLEHFSVLDGVGAEAEGGDFLAVVELKGGLILGNHRCKRLCFKV